MVKNKLKYIIILITFVSYSQKWNDSIPSDVAFEFGYGKDASNHGIILNKDDNYNLNIRFHPERRIHTMVDVSYHHSQLSTNDRTTRDYGRYTKFNKWTLAYNKNIRLNKNHSKCNMFLSGGLGYMVRNISEPWRDGVVYLDNINSLFAQGSIGVEIEVSKKTYIQAKYRLALPFNKPPDSTMSKWGMKTTYHNMNTVRVVQSNLNNITLGVVIYSQRRSQQYIDQIDELRYARRMERDFINKKDEKKRYEGLDLTQAISTVGGIMVNRTGVDAQISLRSSNLRSEDEEKDENNPVNYKHKQPIFELNGTEYMDYPTVYNMVAIGSVISISVDHYSRGNNGKIIIKTE